MSNTFSTPIPAVLEMEWLKILEWYCEAFNLQTAEAVFQAKLAGAKFR